MSDSDTESGARVTEIDTTLFSAKLPTTVSIPLEEFARYADAAKALVATGIVEDWLEKLLLLSFRRLSNRQIEYLFGSNGPLNSFSSRIAIAHAFDLISDTTYEDLRTIKDIRNRFAHTTQYVRFQDSEIDKIAQRFSDWKKDGDNYKLFREHADWCIAQIDSRIEMRLYALGIESREPDGA